MPAPFLIFLPVLVEVLAEKLLELAVLAAVAAAGTGAVAVAVDGTSRAIHNLTTSSTTSTASIEKGTIFDWWNNEKLDVDERHILLENGYSDKTGCFTLEELKSASERMYAEKAPGKPTKEVGYEPSKDWDGRLVKAPKSQKRGYPDKKGSVWVPTGEDTENVKQHRTQRWRSW